MIQRCHDLIAWFVPWLEKLPRGHRHLLGERIQTGLYELLELLVLARFDRQQASVFPPTCSPRVSTAGGLWVSPWSGTKHFPEACRLTPQRGRCGEQRDAAVYEIRGLRTWGSARAYSQLEGRILDGLMLVDCRVVR